MNNDVRANSERWSQENCKDKLSSANYANSLEMIATVSIAF